MEDVLYILYIFDAAETRASKFSFYVMQTKHFRCADVTAFFSAF